MDVQTPPEFHLSNLESVSSRKLEQIAYLEFNVGQTLNFGEYTLQVQYDNNSVSTFDKNQFKFDNLVEAWREERRATSSPIKVVMCPSYQKIIGMGKTAIPLIFRQLEAEGNKPDMWFWALRALTEANPVTDDIKGNFVKMAEAWLEWGRSQYSW